MRIASQRGDWFKDSAPDAIESPFDGWAEKKRPELPDADSACPKTGVRDWPTSFNATGKLRLAYRLLLSLAFFLKALMVGTAKLL